ncbi:hypothetical protein [Nocardiopsis halophila]|uniref:hypothetical protein n=1 Tax=Nocardiopsis halophila TaxID=141692 RepID=UPI000381744A|nr:hypothetical protein [Nocardiopsis halophila]
MGETIAILAMVLPVLGILAGMAVQHRLRIRPRTEALARASAQVNEDAARVHTLAGSLRRSEELIRSGFAEAEAREVLAGAEDRLRRADELLRERDRLADEGGRPAWRTGAEEAARAARRWQELRRDAEGVLADLSAADERYARALAASTALDDGMREAERLVTEVRSAAEDARSRGYAVDGDAAVLAAAGERLQEVGALAAEGRRIAGSDALAALSSELSGARSALRAIGERESQARHRLHAPTDARQRNGVRRSAAVAALTELESGYAAALREGMHAHVESGERSASEVEERLRAAHAALDARDVQRAEAALDAAEQADRSAEEEFAAPVERLEKVRELSAALPRRRSAALIRLTEIAERARGAEGGGHLSPVVLTLRAHVEAMDVQAERPDWLRLDAALAEADALADSLSEACDAAVSSAAGARSEIVRLEQALRRSEEERESAQRLLLQKQGSVPAQPRAASGPQSELERVLVRLRFLDQAADRHSRAASAFRIDPGAVARAARDHAAALWAAGRTDEAARVAEEARDRYAASAGQEAVADLRTVLSLIDTERSTDRR